MENNLREKWLNRFGLIRDRARSAGISTSNHSNTLEGLLPVEEVRRLELGTGAWRTIRGHVRMWERFENSARGSVVYPLQFAQVLRFAVILHAEECGPNVIPSLKASVRWVCARLTMTGPNLEDPTLQSLRRRSVEWRGKDVLGCREALPVPMEAVAAMEIAVIRWANEGRHDASVFTWFLLCATYSSMRYDDALHVVPKSVEMHDVGLLAKAWQTKVDR